MDQTIFLIGSITAILMEGYKWIASRYGKEATRRTIYLGVFAVALLWTVMTQTNMVSQEAATVFAKMVMTSVGVYEVLIKSLKNFLSYGSQTTQPTLPTNTSSPTSQTTTTDQG